MTIGDRLVLLAEKLRGTHDRQYADALLEEVGYGELALGLENLCDNLLDDRVVLDRDVVDEIQAIGELLGLPPKKWQRLREMS